MNPLHDPSAPEAREHPEPRESNNPMPWVVIILTAALMLFGVIYIARSNITAEPWMGDGRTLAELRPAVAASGAAGASGIPALPPASAGGSARPGSGAAPPPTTAGWTAGRPPARGAG